MDENNQPESLMKANEASGVSDDGVPFSKANSLLEARMAMAKYSIEKAAQCQRQPVEDSKPERDWSAGWVLRAPSRSLVLDDYRPPLSGCSISPDLRMIATACSWSSLSAELWTIPNLHLVSTFNGHTESTTDVQFSPTGRHLATASKDRTARLWNQDGSLLRTYEGHLDQLACVRFHPSGSFLATASFDKTWGLWNVETGEKLHLHEGHSRGVYGIAFRNDGCLVASCGFDSLVCLWDVRSSRSITDLEGHVKPVLSVSFSRNGYHLASGGEDNTCRVWDLRKGKSCNVIHAHSNLISQVKFEPQDGYCLVTGSFDMTAKVWSSKDFKLVKTLKAGLSTKVIALDTACAQLTATVSHNKIIKLWLPKDDVKGKDMDTDQ